jgi:hypothetical protein
VSSIEDAPEFIPPTGFSPREWLPKVARKHIPESGRTLESLREESAGRMGDAWYHPRLSHDEIERIEMETVRVGTEFKKKKGNPVLRAYWRDMGEIIGVSKGKDTTYVYVTYHVSGVVHGLPITADELRRKGEKL